MCAIAYAHSDTRNTVKIERSIHRWVHTSIGNTPLPISPRGSFEGSKDESGRGEGGSPEGPLVAQLSHLPIGPSHVLICLLVNPSSLFPPSPYRLFRSLDFRETPVPSRSFFRSLSSSPLVLRPVKSRRRSLRNEFDERNRHDRHNIVCTHQLFAVMDRSIVRVHQVIHLLTLLALFYDSIMFVENVFSLDL